MPPTKKRKVKSSINKKNSGIGYAGGSRDGQSLQSGMNKARLLNQKSNQETLSFLVNFQNTLRDYLNVQDGSDCSNVETSFTFLQSFLASSSPDSNDHKKHTQQKHSSLTKLPKEQHSKDKVRHVLQEVLLNHSPTEWDSREKCQLIHAALGVCDLLAGDIQLTSAVFGTHDGDNEEEENEECSLWNLIMNLANQAKMIASQSQKQSDVIVNDGGDKGEDGAEDVNVATYFLQVHEKLERTMREVKSCHFLDDKKPSAKAAAAAKSLTSASTNQKSQSQSTSQKSSPEKQYKQQMKKCHPFKFTSAPLSHQHTYASKPQYTGDTRRLYRELMSYTQSLPVEFASSIFVRAMEDRIDLLRALVIGPEGTPYSNGAFLFDVYIPQSYPQTSPKVTFLTTGHGKVRFNPNLYKDGKVCLSLLGTWSGPGWIQGKSTLLQVLISIQSLIFVQEPYFNEPGFEREMGTDTGKSKSESYNKQIRKGTYEWGIKDHLGRLERRADDDYDGSSGGVGSAMRQQQLFSEFDDVLMTHFALKANAIRGLLDSWKKKGDTLVHKEVVFSNLSIIEQRHNEKMLMKCAYANSVRDSGQKDGMVVMDGCSNSRKRKKEATEVIVLDDEEYSGDLKFASSLCGQQRSTSTAGFCDNKNKEDEIIILDDDDGLSPLELGALQNQQSSFPAAACSGNKNKNKEDEVILLDENDSDTDRGPVDVARSNRRQEKKTDVIELE